MRREGFFFFFRVSEGAKEGICSVLGGIGPLFLFPGLGWVGLSVIFSFLFFLDLFCHERDE